MSAIPPEVEVIVKLLTDPNADLKAKVNGVNELRTYVDRVRDVEGLSNLTALAPGFLQLLRVGEPAFVKESPELVFRKTLIDVILRMLYADVTHFPFLLFFGLVIHLIRHDNEDNAISALKALADCARMLKPIPPDTFIDFSSAFSEVCRNVHQHALELFTSAPPPAHLVTPAIRSIRTLTEITNVVVAFVSSHRGLPHPAFQNVLPLNFQILQLEIPVQKQAREEHEMTNAIWAGMSPAITNAQDYEDLLLCQSRMAYYGLFVLRLSSDHFRAWGDSLLACSLRILQDQPIHANNPRKDLLGVIRTAMTTEHRRAVVHQIEKLLDERLICGTTLALREPLHYLAYTAVADSLPHMWPEISPLQLGRIVDVFTRLMHNTCLNISTHMAAIKVLASLVEVLPTKLAAQDAAKHMLLIMETTADRIEVGTVLYADAHARLVGSLEPGLAELHHIEKSRPLQGAVYIIDRPEQVINNCRELFSQGIGSVTACLKGLRKCGAPVPDGAIMSKLLRSCILSLAFFAPVAGPNAPTLSAEVLDRLKIAEGNVEKIVTMVCLMLAETHPHTFQEIWTLNMDFFFEQTYKRQYILHVAQFLLLREDTSSMLLPILLKYLTARLEGLGDREEENATVLVRAFRLVFQSVVKFSSKNQGFLSSHLTKIIMDSFPLAVKAKHPSNYYSLVRALFRTMGLNISSMDILFNELVAVLPELLACLHQQLHVVDAGSRDQIVELFLNIPVRLTNLLPHLSFLMRPLAFALRGTNELMSLGLRTLELCIDHLTADFLDPILDTEIRDIHTALFAILQTPVSPHASSVIKILGKLGGRNRKLLYMDPVLSWRTNTSVATMTLPFDGNFQEINIEPAFHLAKETLARVSSTPANKADAFQFIQTTLVVLLQNKCAGYAGIDHFTACLSSLFDCLHVENLQVEAEASVREISRHVFLGELRKEDPSRRNASSKEVLHHHPTPLVASLLDTLTNALVRNTVEECERAKTVVTLIISDIIEAGKDAFPELTLFLHQISIRFNSMCLEDPWTRKAAGCTGITIMLSLPPLGPDWVRLREVELVRTLLHVLKNLPSDLPKDIDRVVDIIIRVLKMSYENLAPEAQEDASTKLQHVMSVFFTELPSQSVIVRESVHRCIDVAASITGKSPHDLLLPHRERGLQSLYTKPLRALQFSTQIGAIEAIRYCLRLTPPLPELNQELQRLLQEVIALASAEDHSLSGRGNVRQTAQDITKLRVACLRLLTSAVVVTEGFTKYGTTEAVTNVFFKSLYFSHPDIKDAARQGIQHILSIQTRLPREMLQNGLKPILTHLNDASKLTVHGLEGLALLIGLLQNYFKVEVGVKLLEHFRVLADPQMLHTITGTVISENEDIKKLVCLANIFHLLPASAHMYLEDLTNAIVNTEAYIDSFSPGPFSTPLAHFLDRYPVEGANLFMRNLHFPRHLRTLRNVLEVGIAPSLQREITSRTPFIVSNFLRSPDAIRITAGLTLCNDLAKLSPLWLTEYPDALDAVLQIWRADRTHRIPVTQDRHQCLLMMELLQRALEQSPRVDLLFDLVSVYSRELPLDLVQLTQFLYRHVTLEGSLEYRRNVLSRFVTWIESDTPWVDKLNFIHHIVTPMLQVQATRDPKDGLLDADFINCLMRCFWQPEADAKTNLLQTAGSTFTVEVLHLCSVVVAHYPSILKADQIQPALAKFIYTFCTTTEGVVKQTSFLLAANFLKSREDNELPEKFVLAPFIGLLKSPDGDTRKTLNEQGLDVIVNVLPRMPADGAELPSWAKSTRRLLNEEVVGFTQSLNVYQLVVRHPSVFYPVRAKFVPNMIYTISRIASFGSQNPEARSLSIDIIEVIFNWEKKTTEAMADGDSMDVDNDNGAGTQQPWLVPLVYRESIVSYLVRLAVTALGDTSANTRPVFAPKALAMVRQLLGPTGWKDVTVKLNYYSRNLEQADLTDAAALHQALGAARVLHGVCADQPDEWYREQGMTLQRLIRKGLLTDAPHLASTLMPIFERLIKLYPIRQEEEDVSSLAEFHDYVRTVLSDAVAISTTSLRPMIYMLAALARADAESVAPFSTTVLRLFQRLAKEYNDAAPENEALIQLFIPLMETIRLSIDYMGDQKKQLWTAVMWVPDKCRNLAMCGYLLQFARAIVLERQESYPTQKEKALLLGKLYAWDRLSQEKTPGHPNHAVLERQREFAGLFTQYLDLIYSIYAEPTLRRSDLTARLEAPFLVGCRARDLSLREKFITLLDANIPRSLFSRLSYIIGSQNWEPLQDVNWIFLASYLLLGSVNGEALISPNVDDLMTGSSPLITTSRRSQDLVDPLRRMLVLDPTLGHEVWVSLFPAVWTGLLRREQVDLTHYMITLLSKDYHHTQAGVRSNVIQSLLEGISACVPAMILPPHLVKYLAKNYGAWHVSIDILVGALDYVMDDPSTRDIVYDALAELYAELAEEDAFYGLWRRRAVHPVTSVAIALEEMGMWEQASATYEQVLIKARSGASSYTEPEYCLWEDHWVLAQEKLQQWDILYDLGRTEGNYELMLEAAWRTKNWSETRESMEELVSHLPETLTPRRAVFSGLLCHLKPSSPEQLAELERHHLDCDRLTLHKWISLPARLSRAHVPLLQHWQQSLELTEAKTIFGVLAQTSAQNLEKKSQELKMTLQAWRERLPGPADDISIWSDLVGWRRNIFNAINFVYQPLIQQLAQGGGNANGNAGTQNTLGYRGYHETAWIINRFAHVARKHDLLDVCHSQLVSIYTLPNIEISEAFLKLREQARCHYLKPDELASGLEVVNNTNLMYFTSAQKAEFFTLKGMFFAKMGRVEDANNAFGQAVQTDMVQAKAWAQWGKFNDRLFKEHKSELNYGANAVSCYLQAAGLYKSGKSRPLLARVLWLLSVDDASLTISRQFDQYKGEAAFWYWITFIPQLCLSISHREVKQARYILLNLARLFPQALFYTLRTTREDMLQLRKQQQQIAAQRAAVAAAAAGVPNAGGDGNPGAVQSSPPGGPDTMVAQTGGQPTGQSSEVQNVGPGRGSWEYVDEIVQILKTAFPLLVLSLETVVDQIAKRFKTSGDEEQYRILCVLTNDAIQTYVYSNSNAEDDGMLNAPTIEKISRFSHSLTGNPSKENFDKEFIETKITHLEYIRKIQAWRDRYEKDLDARPKSQSLDLVSHYLTEFHYGKFDDIEVPGQYTESRDTNTTFVRIQKFHPKFDICRTNGWCYRRITIQGNDYSRTSFAVRSPSHRHWRREDRLMQTFRTFNVTLGFAKETRKRNLVFCVPATVQLHPNLRLEQNSARGINLSDVYDQWCEQTGITREEPMIAVGERLKQTVREWKQAHGRPLEKVEYWAIKERLIEEVATKMVPTDVLTQYFTKTMNGPTELWMMRKQFASQMAAINFMTYIFCIAGRNPSRYTVSRDSGRITMHELTPSFAAAKPIYNNIEVVPFRFTPNMQRFIGPILTEGIVTTGMVAIGRALTDPEDELEQQLCLFSRDEVLTWLHVNKQPALIDITFRNRVEENTAVVVERARHMACTVERQQHINPPAPGVQTMMISPLQSAAQLLSQATSPLNLTKMTEMYQPWF